MERNLDLGRRGGVPACQVLDVLLADSELVAVAQRRLEQDADRKRQLVQACQPELLEPIESEIARPALARFETIASLERVNRAWGAHGRAIPPKPVAVTILQGLRIQNCIETAGSCLQRALRVLERRKRLFRRYTRGDFDGPGGVT